MSLQAFVITWSCIFAGVTRLKGRQGRCRGKRRKGDCDIDVLKQGMNLSLSYWLDLMSMDIYKVSQGKRPSYRHNVGHGVADQC